MSHYTTVLNEKLNFYPDINLKPWSGSTAATAMPNVSIPGISLSPCFMSSLPVNKACVIFSGGMEANPARIYHLGLPDIKRSTLEDANSRRSYQVFEGLFYKLLDRCREVTPLFDITPDSIYCMDKSCTDFTWYRLIRDGGAFFVTQAKDNLKCRFIGQHSVTDKKGVLADQLIELEGFYSKQDYPHPLRLIHYYDAETDKELVVLTGNMRLSALTIAQIYKARRQIEIFFKWIKQNLKIKTFLGTSGNAVSRPTTNIHCFIYTESSRRPYCGPVYDY